jgi:hypothetical protein
VDEAFPKPRDLLQEGMVLEELNGTSGQILVEAIRNQKEYSH